MSERPAAPSGRAPLRLVVDATRKQDTGVTVVEAPAHTPPFAVQAIALEDDTCHVLSADATTIRDHGEHPIRLMTALFDHEPASPGTVVVQGRRPLRLLAVVHDLDRDPSVDEAWVRQAIAEIVRICEERRITALALEPLGAKHGRLSRARFRELLDACLVRCAPRVLKRIWVLVG